MLTYCVGADFTLDNWICHNVLEVHITHPESVVGKFEKLQSEPPSTDQAGCVMSSINDHNARNRNVKCYNLINKSVTVSSD